MKKSELRKIIRKTISEAMQPASGGCPPKSCMPGHIQDPVSCDCVRTSSLLRKQPGGEIKNERRDDDFNPEPPPITPTSGKKISGCECKDGTYSPTCDCPGGRDYNQFDIDPLDADGNPRPMPKRMLNEKETACQKAAKIGINNCYDNHIQNDGTLGSGHSACHNAVIATFKACKKASGGMTAAGGPFDQPFDVDNLAMSNSTDITKPYTPFKPGIDIHQTNKRGVDPTHPDWRDR